MIKELRILKKLEDLTGEGSQKKKQEIIKENWNEDLSYIFDICLALDYGGFPLLPDIYSFAQ